MALFVSSLITLFLFINTHSDSICDIVSCGSGYECAVINNFALCQPITNSAHKTSNNVDNIPLIAGSANFYAHSQVPNMDLSCDTLCNNKQDRFCCLDITYTNLCYADCYGITDINRDCYKGKCTDDNVYALHIGPKQIFSAGIGLTQLECVCEIHWHPLCCNDIDYDNQCEARCDGIETPLLDCQAGTCESQDCEHNSAFDPYCCDGQDFDNQFTAECNGYSDIVHQCKRGTCVSNCLCPNVNDVYCCNNQTYANPCQANCDGYDITDILVCANGTCASNHCGCNDQYYEPLCCNGQNYLSSCHAECDGITTPMQEQSQCFMGVCEHLRICSHQHNPICCDGQDFNNECAAKSNGIYNTELCLSGSCDNQENNCHCTREYDPLCCSTVTYSNTCAAECIGGVAHPAKYQSECQLGICDICTCDTIYAPVCCLGQVEFDNECIAMCSVDINDTSTSCVSGTCIENSHCPREYNPVCCTEGRDQITYDNQCLADLNNAQDCHSGICDFEECMCDREWDPYCCQTKLGQVQFDSACIAECSGVEDAEMVCEAGMCDSQPCGCEIEYDPLCCDGVTYYNGCNAECYGIPYPAEESAECMVGTCAEQSDGCNCLKTYNPYCCNGNDYSNLCHIACADGTLSLEECEQGTCAKQLFCVCTHEYNPICCNGQDFINPCIASCSGDIIDSQSCSAGTCTQQNGCLCPRQYQPLCCDNQDYSNPCMAECNGIPNPATLYCSTGICEHENTTVTTPTPLNIDTECTCTDEYDPWCCNGEIYSNECEAKCADFCDPLHDGRCIKGDCTLTQTTQTPSPTSGTNIPTPLPVIGPFMCLCALIMAPVCCEGRQYDNKCLAQCHFHVENATKECVSGECMELQTTESVSVETTEDSECVCSDEYWPYCCDGITYNNRCEAECAGVVGCDTHCVYGECGLESDECECSDEYWPYCCNGKTYNNECEAECDGIKKVLKKCKFGECDGNQMFGVSMKNYLNVLKMPLVVFSVVCFGIGLTLPFCLKKQNTTSE